MLNVEARFWELCDEATRHDQLEMQLINDDESSPEEVELEARAREQAMVKIIALVENHPDERSIFVRCFSELVMWKRPVPFLLVAFCMRKLRYPEIPELIQRDAAAHEGTAYYANHMNHWSAINHAYLDKVWENAIAFDYYKHELTDVGSR